MKSKTGNRLGMVVALSFLSACATAEQAREGDATHAAETPAMETQHMEAMHSAETSAAVAKSHGMEAAHSATEPAMAVHDKVEAEHGVGPLCKGFGPQTPRDIDQKKGENNRLFSLSPSYKKMNLCNIHFHTHAEHKAKDFSLFAGEGEHGHGGGYRCLSSMTLTPDEIKLPAVNHCEGVKPGDTVEVHWVYSSCDITPGEGLKSCLSESCANPNLRVESQVFTVVNDGSAMDFMTMVNGGNSMAGVFYGGHKVNGYHQAKSLPNKTGNPVVFLGSTTGPKYTAQSCSPMQVTWSVRPKCAKVDINSLSTWCEGNVFNENHAHGVRQLVVEPELLSTIK